MQGGRCILCGEPILMEGKPTEYGSPSVEHKIPISHGGAAWRRNLALSHRECNHLRGPRLSLKVVRPPETESPDDCRRRVVPLNGIWHSHFRLPVEDHCWERPEQRERLLRRLAK